MKHERKYTFKNTVYRQGDGPAQTVFTGPLQLEMGPAAEFGGKAGTLNPEEMFVAAINACLMTTFFYFARKLNIRFLSYHSDAEAELEKQADGFRFTKVNVEAKVTLQDAESGEKAREAAKLSEKYCLVSRSVACPVNYTLSVEATGVQE